MSQRPQQVEGERGAGMRYERLFALGSGGMARVELALAVGPSGFNRLVVLKSTHKEHSSSELAHAMFLDEARLSARLSHPNVVHISEVIDSPEGVVLVMEYLDGLSLTGAYRAANTALTLPMRIRIICEVLAGLHYAHELTDFLGRPLGIVHRDVSPQNVFVTYDGRVKLLDFGIAKSTSTEQTSAGMVKGRIAYMPAEQLTARVVDRRTDVYSVGCLLWEAIAGRRIWQDQTERDIARAVVSGTIPPLSSRVQVDPELERIVTKATALAPDDRYPSAEAMRLELERYLASLGVVLTTRDIGAMLSKVSSEARDRRQQSIADAIAALGLEKGEAASSRPRRTISAVRRIELQAAAATSSEPSPSRAEDGGTPASARLPPAEVAEGTKSRTLIAIGPPRSRLRLPLVVGLLGVVGVAAFFGYRRLEAESTRATAAQAQRVTSSPVATAHALTIAARPSDARLFVDGSEVRGNPAVIDVPAGSEHTVRVEREGYEPSERVVSLKGDVTLDIELAPHTEANEGPSKPDENPRSATPKARSRYVASPVVAPRPTARPQKDCEPPFYFVNGNKTYKPECI
jgi:eukaryotic-like serine/threonine-protein kinase